MCWLSQYTPLSNGAYYVKHLYSVERYTLLCKATPSKFTDESGGGSGLINQNEEERGGGSSGNRRLLVEGSGQMEEPRRDKGKGTGISSISNILNP